MKWTLARVRPLQQMEAAECGVACLAMVLDHHGSSRSLDEVRGACGTSRDGNSVWDLLNGARTLGLDGAGLGMGLEDLTTLPTPAILHWEMNHFVVLERVKGRRARIVDPASGRRWVDHGELDRCFSGVALELWPTLALPRIRRRSPSYSRYLRSLLSHRSSLSFVILASVLSRFFAIVYPAATQVLLDHVVQQQRAHWLPALMAALAAAMVAQLGLVRLHGYAHASLQAGLESTLTERLVRHLLRLPLPFLESRSHGDLLERVRAQADLRSLLTTSADALFDVVFVGLLIALLLAYDLRLGSLSLGLTLLRLLLIRAVRGAGSQRNAAELALRGREHAALVEATASPEMIKGLGCGRRLADRYMRQVAERAEWTERSMRLEQGIGQAATAFGGVQHALIVLLAGSQVIQGAMTVGVFAGFLAVRALIEAPLHGVAEAADRWLRFRGVLDRCDDVLSVCDEPDGELPVPLLRGRLQLVDVSFRYGSGGPWVLRHVNLTIEPGEHVVLHGPSGEGKSTLGKLLAGLLRPTEGRVLLDGLDVSQLRPDELARRYGVVPQEPFAMPGPLREALRIRLPEAPVAELDTAVRLACFDDVLRKLPAGYETTLQAHAANLSGGERQRLALAQALLGSPEVLLMDEATSALDSPVEARLLANLASLDCTRISIAHRSAVLARADRAFWVTNGAVRESGAPSRASPARALQEVVA